MKSEKVGTLTTFVLAQWYSDATEKALKWANEHPDHKKYAPWVAYQTDVAA